MVELPPKGRKLNLSPKASTPKQDFKKPEVRTSRIFEAGKSFGKEIAKKEQNQMEKIMKSDSWLYSYYEMMASEDKIKKIKKATKSGQNKPVLSVYSGSIDT